MKAKRPESLEGKSYQSRTEFGNLYVTVNSHEGTPFEVFLKVSKAGTNIAVICDSIGRLISLLLRHGIDREEIIKQLSKVHQGELVTVPEAISRALTKGTG